MHVYGLLIVLILVILWTCGTASQFQSVNDAVATPNDWNQYIRDQAQRVVYLLNDVKRGGECFPEVVGLPVNDAMKYIKEKNPNLYIVLNDERVPQRADIYYSQPNRVVLTFDARGYVSRIPLSG